MNAPNLADSAVSAARTNGSGAAAILSAGIGAVCLGVFTVAADKSPMIKSMFNVYKPTGALSGVTTGAIAIWLICWAVLALRWRSQDVHITRIVTVAFVLLGLSFLLTFPPIGDLF
jgi:multisubunit Na+/H+ antiporter MnhB subunit